jgi:hypothetical protein
VIKNHPKRLLSYLQREVVSGRLVVTGNEKTVTVSKTRPLEPIGCGVAPTKPIETGKMVVKRPMKGPQKQRIARKLGQRTGFTRTLHY